ncbi:probable LRR receptor-like serine/threonine-protein kinase At1g56130 isoform X2 [Ananas comosus]|uniref:non-specific serine/threonine protein kinase n=1 Tax=Ananas comosus TaxID=4615 RepID=A0A6P5GCK7_ANACO|nr:probable LRR receptor-like serine/threonine-protein kinase At1g56130 isoform X2 [Ananas comosus]
MVVLRLPTISPSQYCFNLLFTLCLFLFVGRATAQAKTDPSEVQALNTILGRWGKVASAAWNISGEPCSGAAIDSTSFDDPNFNPAIKCDCSYNNKTTCHITQLKVYALDVVGPIPEELQNLTYLFNLNLAQNYLTGPLPAFIGNFSAMQYLSVGINALSGPVPKELGKLRNLLSLSISSNNFNGSIPPELGNLTSLQQLYIDSSGLSGELPSTLSNLENLQKLWGSDNNFTGQIPDFIGSWTNMLVLRFQGNSFEGPIPSSLSNLGNLTDLRIGDITSGRSSLDFVRNMTSLSNLVLRNCKISDTIPSSFGQFLNLQQLDLSFNNITGQLPPSLFSLNLLSYLFLGNNSLSGSLPAQKSTSLLNVDLSYNQLSGSFPSWVSQPNLKLNVVANNFVIDSSNNSILPSGLNCLQRNIPCYLGSPIYSSFGINCGGSKDITASDGTLYEIDDAALSAASYYVTGSTKWGVSNVGRFADASNASYIIASLSQFQNTLTSELFQTARMSPSSLRYYGIGLQNGNYTVKLQFAEIAFPNPPTWKSVGRRVFDVYIQGDLKAKDLDVRKEAGGTSFKAVVKTFVAPVTNNFLEIHFFWAGKGTCCIPTQGYYGPFISALSVSPYDFTPNVTNELPSTGSKSKTGLVVGLVVGIAVLGLLVIVGVFVLWRRKRRPGMDDDEFLSFVGKPDIFSYAELRSATEDFSPENILGEGGFGAVYKGKLSDGRIVGVKQLSVTSHQGKHQFVTEIATISQVQHRNLVKLYGCCIEGNKPLLVYEYLENRSLDQAIFGKNSLHLDWTKRFEICLGVARGLAYLHEESSVRIVHRDVKASNILLDADLNPKISDFGLAKLYDDKMTHISTRIAGTIGYLAPEYAMRGHLTEKADVFSFGVVALEVVSGRSNSDPSLEEEKVYLLDWAWHLYENKCALEMVDPRLTSFKEEEAARVIGVALLCTQASPLQRPPMSRVVAMLAGDVEVSKVTTKPGYLTEYQFKDASSSYFSESSSGPSAQQLSSNQVSVLSGSSTGAHTTVETPLPSQSLMGSIISEGR